MNMLSVLVCVAVCLATVSAASWSVLGDSNIVAGWTGAFKGPDYAGKMWTFPVTDHGYTAKCVPEPSSTYGSEYYVAMPITFQTTAVRKVFGFSQVYSGQDFFKVFVYANTFDPTSPCENLVTRIQGEEYQVDDHVLFTAGVQYTIVASSLNDITKFAINILESVSTGNTGTSGQLPNFNSNSGASGCSKSAVTSPYYTYEWTQTTTGFFDLTGGYALNQSDNRAWILANTFLALYNGSVSADLTAGNVCNANLVAVGQSNPVNRDAMIVYQRLVAGNKYTLVSYSQTDDAYGDVGVYVTPASRRSFAGQGFKQPVYHNYEYSNDKDKPTGCDADPDLSQSGYFAFSFTALYDNVALVNRLGSDVRNIDNPAIMYLYEGDNTATPPSTCGTKLLRRHDMYYGTFWFNTEPGKTYTIVGAGVKGETYGKSFYVPMYLLTGTQVGSVKASYEGYYEGYSSSASALSLCFVTIFAFVSALLM